MSSRTLFSFGTKLIMSTPVESFRTRRAVSFIKLALLHLWKCQQFHLFPWPQCGGCGHWTMQSYVYYAILSLALSALPRQCTVGVVIIAECTRGRGLETKFIPYRGIQPPPSRLTVQPHTVTVLNQVTKTYL